MLSLAHLIYMAGDKCMRQNACLNSIFIETILNNVSETYLYLHVCND